MKKALILDGAPKDNPALQDIRAVMDAKLSCHHFHVGTFFLAKTNITHCRGCFDCWSRYPGRCKFKDAGRDIAESIISSDVAIFITPVTFGGYSAELKKALDRIICLVLPFFTTIQGEVHHQKRYPRYPRLIAIGTLHHPDSTSERIFTSLVQRNARNFHTTGYSTVLYLDRDTAEVRRERIDKLFKQLELNVDL